MSDLVPHLCRAVGKTCPVCGKQSYSKGGIHPQCAVRRIDEAMSARLRAERKSAVHKPKLTPSTSKKCPKCGTQSHVRLKKCSCGHFFF